MRFLNRTRKAHEKHGIISLVFISPSGVMVLKLPKIVSILQFKAVTAIYVYVPERSCFALLENGVGYYATT